MEYSKKLTHAHFSEIETLVNGKGKFEGDEGEIHAPAKKEAEAVKPEAVKPEAAKKEAEIVKPEAATKRAEAVKPEAAKKEAEAVKPDNTHIDRTRPLRMDSAKFRSNIIYNLNLHKPTSNDAT